jgi:hypothetical protein
MLFEFRGRLKIGLRAEAVSGLLYRHGRTEALSQ